MTGSGRMRVVRDGGRAVAMVLALGSVSACRDVGLAGNIPREEAENRQFRYALYQGVEGAGHDAGVLSFDSRNWMASAATIPVPERLMQPVGSSGAGELFAPVWSQAPHGRLYLRASEGHWHPVTPVL